MGCPHYLAKTQAEFCFEDGDDRPAAWMACHFSPYGTGLSGLPRKLPPGSLLMLDDITPIHGHDVSFIGEQLQHCVEALECKAVLLDFQRPGYGECDKLIQHLSESLSCPVGVSSLYGEASHTPVLLPPLPFCTSLESYLASWKGREIWLETALEGETITVTENGSKCSPLFRFSPPENGFSEEVLHCHYRAEVQEDRIVFTLWRTKEDVEGLLNEAEAMGIPLAVGLYQEWKDQRI